MRPLLGIGFAVLGAVVWGGQVVSTVNWPLAQRLGLQERTEAADPLFGGLERWTARWDVLSMWTLPVAGVLMMIDHSWWPWAALVGGGVWADTGGRELAKWLGLRQQGVDVGTDSDRRLLVGTLGLVAVGGLVAILAGLVELA